MDIIVYMKKLIDSDWLSLRIQQPLSQSRYYVRNAKRVFLRVSHVVAGANERRLYSQAMIG